MVSWESAAEWEFHSSLLAPYQWGHVAQPWLFWQFDVIEVDESLDGKTLRKGQTDSQFWLRKQLSISADEVTYTDF